MSDVTSPPPEFLKALTRQQRFLVRLLIGVYPRYLSPAAILENLPGIDHAADRQWACVKTVVSQVRKKLGIHSIQNLRGDGYRISPKFWAQLEREKYVDPR